MLAERVVVLVVREVERVAALALAHAHDGRAGRVHVDAPPERAAERQELRLAAATTEDYGAITWFTGDIFPDQINQWGASWSTYASGPFTKDCHLERGRQLAEHHLAESC